MGLFDTSFTLLDWGIVGIYLVVSIVIGVVANRYVGNLAGYLVAGRTLRTRLALATMTGTEIGLVTVIYSAELGFTQQYASLYLALYELLSLLIIGLTGFVIYRLRQTEVMTIPEYYQQRYSRGVRVLGAVMMVISGVLNMGLFLKAGSLFLVCVTGLQDVTSLKVIMSLLLLLVLFYTVLGGMVSVVITDLIQFLVLGTAMLLVTGCVLYEVGIDGLAAVATDLGGYVNPVSTDNPTQPGMNDGIGPLGLTSQAVVLFIALMLWPAGASRTLACRTPEIAQRLYLLSAIPFLSRRSLPVLWGIGAFAWFAAHPEINTQFQQHIADGTLNTQAAMPLFLAKVIPTGLLGIVTAGMVAAFMSTHDSYLLCWSGVVARDIVEPLAGGLSQRQSILVTRISIVVIGILLLVWGLWYEVSSNLWNYMAVTGTVYLAGVFPVVVGGLYWRRSSTAGAYVALLLGVTGLLGMAPGVKAVNKLLASAGSDAPLTVTAAHMMLLTFAVSLLGFIIGSLLKPDPPRPIAASPVAESEAAR